MLAEKQIESKLETIERQYLDLRFEKVADVAMQIFETPEHFRDEPRGPKSQWTAAAPGDRWGGSGITAWFRGDVKLAAACARRKVFLRARTGGTEALLLVDGEHRGVFDANHPVVMMTAKGEPGRRYHVALEAYAGHTFPGTQPYDDGSRLVVHDKMRVFDGVEVFLEREDVSAFVFDLMALRQLAGALDPDSLRRGEIVRGLCEVWEIVDAMPAETGEASWRPKLARARRILRPLLARRNGATVPRFGLIGHSHIDTAWLWPLSETWRKCARTFSSMLNLMEQYPELTFLQSAPCHAEMTRKHYPGVFRRMQQMAAAGRWEPNGAMWVEPDCNIPSGESFVRQLLVGQAAAREMFGVTADTLWLPDVFGYSAALPQILRLAGVEFFCTTKIGWNDTTRFPYDTFLWKGIDGTSVISHFNMTHCRPDPPTLIDRWKWVQHKDVQDRMLCAFGFGDGGGGPQAEMMEIARRVGDLEGCPRTEYTTVGKFMRGIRDELTDLPVYAGELYLEFHRGTLTSIAKIKRGNRKAELALRDAELLWTLATLRGAKYPAARLRECWKTLLVNQFHDILPGSSIAEVNDEAVTTLECLVSEVKDLSREALPKATGRAAAAGALVVNTLSWDRCGEMALDGVPEGTCPADPQVAWQWVADVAGPRKLVVSGFPVPALGAAVLPLTAVAARPAGESGSPFRVSANTVETPHAKVRLDRTGRIVSFVDKATGRQLVAPGGALNTFLIGEDIPLGWDNWDIDPDQRRKMQVANRRVGREVVARGPLQLRIRSRYRLPERSTVVQDMVFHADSPRVDFETVVDWSEKHRLFKVAFALDVLADFARFEIQYGHVERATHRNYPPDRARFEVCHHKWADLSETGFGVALLNDCKYGIGVWGGELRLSLIKSGTHPDARGDAGHHEFTYSLLPHACGFSAEAVVRPAYELNVPPVVVPAGPDAVGVDPLVTVDAPNVIVDTVKWAESGNAFIVRLYEAEKTGTRAKLRFAAPVSSVRETNLLEETPQSLPWENDSIRLYFRPFEIKTLRCEL